LTTTLAGASFATIMYWVGVVLLLPAQGGRAGVAFKKCPFFEGGFFKL